MVKQYAHSMTVTIAGSSSQDASGNWVTSPPTEVVKSCRAEPNSTNGKITTADGSRIDFSWVVYLPLPIQILPVGATIVVMDGASQLLRDTIKRFSIGQLNARIWL